MTIPTVEAETSLEAWKAGAAVLLQSGLSVNNLITVITNPCQIDSNWPTQFSPHLFESDGDNIKDVVNTIFPRKLAARSQDRNELYSAYLERHDRARSWGHRPRAWGTYFERLVRFPGPSRRGANVNQLEECIQKLCKWSRRSTTGLVFHLSSPAIDAPRTRGGPCWHYGELLWNPNDTIDLVAVYRNHDFYNKVLGNFIGLGLLLGYICGESGKTAGRLVCHSVHAYCDPNRRHALVNMAS